MEYYRPDGWLLSSWDPYQVTVMQSTLKLTP